MEKTDITKKVRNYYVYNAGLSLLFSSVMTTYANCVPIDINKSAMMCGFSWAHGGAEKLVKMLTTPEKWGVDIKFKIYSDDMTIAFVDETGKVRVIAADLKFHDLRLTSDWIEPVIKYFEKTMVDAEGSSLLTNTTFKILSYNVLKSFKSFVMMPNSKICYFYDSLKSGINGTTYIGSVVSGFGAVRLMTKLSDRYVSKNWEGEKNFDHTIVEKLLVESFSELGMVIKPGTEKSYVLGQRYEEDYTSDFTILGQRLYYGADKRWLPKPDVENLYTSFLRPTKNISNENERIKYHMLRAFGLCASGGYHYDEFYLMCQTFWDKHIKTHIIEFDDKTNFELKVGMEDFHCKEFSDYIEKYKTGDKNFPTKYWFKNIYLSEEDKHVVKIEIETIQEFKKKTVLDLPPEVAKGGKQSWYEITQEIEAQEEEMKKSGIYFPEEEIHVVPETYRLLNEELNVKFKTTKEKQEERKRIRKILTERYHSKRRMELVKFVSKVKPRNEQFRRAQEHFVINYLQDKDEIYSDQEEDYDDFEGKYGHIVQKMLHAYAEEELDQYDRIHNVDLSEDVEMYIDPELENYDETSELMEGVTRGEIQMYDFEI